jgi:hypothetical protein
LSPFTSFLCSSHSCLSFYLLFSCRSRACCSKVLNVLAPDETLALSYQSIFNPSRKHPSGCPIYSCLQFLRLEKSLPRPQRCWLDRPLHPCLPAVMRCETTTPTKTHHDLHHTQHHPSHPILASGPVYPKSGSIDGPSYSSSSSLEVSSLSQGLRMTSAPLDEKRSPHAPVSNRWAALWHRCLTTWLKV